MRDMEATKSEPDRWSNDPSARWGMHVRTNSSLNFTELLDLLVTLRMFTSSVRRRPRSPRMAGSDSRTEVEIR